MKRNHRGHDWLRQARDDLQYARAALADGFYAQTCFMCQQASEKALKSILYSKGANVVLTHSLYRLCRQLKINRKLLKAAGLLDQYYLSARYPDALPEGTPRDVFTREQAEEALEYAEEFIARASRSVGK